MTALGAIEEGGVGVINFDRECRCWGQDKPRPDSCVSMQAPGENTSIDGLARSGEISLRYGVVLLIR